MAIIQGGNSPIILELANMTTGNITDSSAVLSQGGQVTKRWSNDEISIVDNIVTLPLTQQETIDFAEGLHLIEFKYILDTNNVYLSEQKTIVVTKRQDKDILGDDVAGDEQPEVVQMDITTNTVYTGGGSGGDSYTKQESDNKYATKTALASVEDIANSKQPQGNYATSTQLNDLQDEVNAIDVPTKTSDITNDSGFINKSVAELDNFYDKTQVDSKVTSVFKYKGAVDTFAQLPTSFQIVGDTYDVRDTGINYAWNGTSWDNLGGIIDLSDYAKKSEIPTTLPNPNALIINGTSYDGSKEVEIEIQGGGSYDDTELRTEIENINSDKQDKPRQEVSASADPVLNLKNNEEYTFTSPLSSLTISTQEGIGSIYFLTNNSFSVILPESIIWDGGTEPEWKPLSIYVLVYFNGIVMASKGA